MPDHTPDLFDALAPAARATDPATSHEAAGRVTRSGRRQAHCAAVLEMVQRWPGSTSVELFAAQGGVGLDRVEVSRRLPDLEKAGRVRRGEARVCRQRGVRMVTWWPTEGQP